MAREPQENVLGLPICRNKEKLGQGSTNLSVGVEVLLILFSGKSLVELFDTGGKVLLDSAFGIRISSGNAQCRHFALDLFFGFLILVDSFSRLVDSLCDLTSLGPSFLFSCCKDLVVSIASSRQESEQ